MGRQTLVQLVAVVVLLAGGLALRGPDHVGAMSDYKADALGELCYMEGGSAHYEFNADGSVKSVTCTGGSMGSWTVESNPDTTDTGGTVTGVDGSLQEITIAVEDAPLATDLPAAATTPLTPDNADQPMLVEAVVFWNPSAEAAMEAGLVQINGCRLFGGTDVVTHPDGNPESPSFTVQCQDGLRDGLWCTFGVGLSTCFFVPGSGPDATTRAPATGDATTAPSMATDASTAPSVEATDVVTAPPPTATVVPTEEPVIESTAPLVEPTLPMFEPVEPTPTEVILT